MNYYEILAVEPTAKLQDIRNSYKRLVLKLHPDRALINKDTDNEKEANPRKAGKVVNIEFYQVQDAWKTLSNPSRRFLYDMRTFGSSTEFPEEDESYLLDLEKAQAERDLSGMSTYLQKVVRRETRAKGVIILDAWYGDLSVLRNFYLAFEGKGPVGRLCEDGLFTDVKVALQCQVDYKAHRLIIGGGTATSRADLPGFYNPIPLSLRPKVELGIFIRYQFGDEVHEILANDTEAIYVPKRSHSVTAIKARLKQEEQRWRRIVAEKKKEKQMMWMKIGVAMMFVGGILVKQQSKLRKIFV